MDSAEPDPKRRGGRGALRALEGGPASALSLTELPAPRLSDALSIAFGAGFPNDAVRGRRSTVSLAAGP